LLNVDFLQEIFLASEDAERWRGSLSKLSSHLAEPVVVTGSIATYWHLAKNGVTGKMTRLNDIDVVVDGLPGILASLNQDFLIRHFHPNRGRGRILIMLVDEEHRTRIDVFTPGSTSLASRLTEFSTDGLSCRVVSAEDLSAKLLSVIYQVTNSEPVESKYVESFRALLTVVDLTVVKNVWMDYRKEGQPWNFEEAAEAVERSLTAHPELLQVGHYSQDVHQACRWCCESELFPLAALSRIYEILGHV
jgi:hypothetical protein